jgi:hypothetical protein
MAKKIEVTSDPFAGFEFPTEKELIKDHQRALLQNPDWQKKYGAESRWKDPEFKKMMAENNSKPKSQATKKKLSEAQKGKPKNAESKKKEAETIRKRQLNNEKVHKTCRSVHTPLGVFHNYAIICENFNITKASIINRCKSTLPRWKDWYYIDQKG